MNKSDRKLPINKLRDPVGQIEVRNYTSYPFAWSFSSIEIASTAMQATILAVILNQNICDESAA